MARTPIAIGSPSSNVTVTVQVSQHNLITIDNSPHPPNYNKYTVTLILDTAGITEGMEVYVKRYSNVSANPIIIQSNNNAQIQNASGKFAPSLYLSTAYEQYSVGFIFRGGSWENITNTELGTEAFWINNVKFFGAIGNGIADDTAAIQAAVNNAASSATPQAGESAPSVDNKEVIVYFPRGTYKITDTIKVYGTVVLRGCAGGTYACSTILQVDPAQFTMISLEPDLYDGISNSTVIEDLAFKSATTTSPPNIAQIRTASVPNINAPGYPKNSPNPPKIQTNSIYIRNCWFKSPQNFAIDITQGDDIQITGCTFDVAPYSFIRLGTGPNNRPVSNISITNNTFFNCVKDCIKAYNIFGGTISNNRVYNNSVPTDVPFFDNKDLTFVNAKDGVLKHVTISANETSRVNKVMMIPSGSLSVAINANVCQDVKDFFIQLQDGGVVYNMAVTGNAVNSATRFSRPAIDDGGDGGPGYTGIQNSVFMGNTFFSEGQSGALPSNKGIQLKGINTSNNYAIGFNSFFNFTTPYDM